MLMYITVEKEKRQEAEMYYQCDLNNVNTHE